MNSDLLGTFNHYFELVHADTDELRMQVYLLRYQVYVLETGFESNDDCGHGFDADGQPLFWEQDDFDRRSDHYLVLHRRTGAYAGTCRLILPERHDVDAPYPIELHCLLDQRVSEPTLRAHLAEISRFAVSKAFKRRLGESGSLAGVASNVEIYFEEDERRVLPHISLGLFAAVMRMVSEHDVTHCYAVMEPALLRLVGRSGVIFNRIGPDVDYHGLRVPCLAVVDEALPHIHAVAPSIWDLITNRGEFFRQRA